MTEITKKAAKAAEVAANKAAAYGKKVRALAGWVNISNDTLFTAYAAGTTAEDFAVSYACATVVGAAIWPLKVAAVQAAAKYAREEIEEMAAKLKAAEWNLDTVAPRPVYGRVSRYDYSSMSAERSRYYSVFSIETVGNVMNAKHIAKRNAAYESRFITQAEESAAYQYNLSVLKLVAKIGAGAVSATLTGDHVWSWSVLSVTMTDGTVQRWKTQQITNRTIDPKS